MKTIIKIICLTLLFFLIFYTLFFLSRAEANWKDEAKLYTASNIETCRGYMAVHYEKWNRIYTCFQYFDVTEEEKQIVIEHEYAHVLWKHITPTERYQFFMLHYESQVRDDFLSDYSVKWNYSEDIYRQDFLEDFADTIAYTKFGKYECFSIMCTKKTEYAKDLISKYY